MSAPTSGPWVIRASRDRSGDIAIVADGDIVAECFAAIRRRDELAMEECRANALLITAAKDLLAAAKAPVVKQVGAALYIGFQDEHGGWSVEVPAEMRPIVERWTASRDAAVAKAVTP